ncbi:glycosyltransferase [Clostridium sp.]|uniref:glycosyltransferase n=1 Tax=Clostridium sp. TaxID=1506 RepID=UPI002FC7AEA3
MRICYLADASSSHTKKWCKYFKNLGYDIHVISLNSGEIEGTQVHSLGIDSSKVAYGGLLSKASYVSRILTIRKLVKEINPDILHAHYASSYGLLGSLCGFHPYVLSVWGSDIYTFPRGSSIKRRVLEHNLKSADYLMSTSRDMARETKLYTNKEIMITPFGVDTNIFKPVDVNRDRDNIVIGTIKTLEPHYGIDYLIRAFHKLTLEYENILLKIAGKGSQEEELKSLVRELNIEDRVEFLGFLSLNNIPVEFSKMDIAVIPSIHESFGVSSIEAQAVGRPVVVTDAGGLPETIEDKVTGILVKKEDVNSLYQGIKTLIDNRDLREQMGRSAIEFVQENYTVDKNFSEVNEFYKTITDKQFKEI